MAKKGKYSDCEWNYFLEDLKNEMIPGIDYEKMYTAQLGIRLFDEGIGMSEQYDKTKQVMVDIFKNYRTMESSSHMKAWVEDLINKHTELCKNGENKEKRSRIHNAVVYKYMTKNIHQDITIAKKLGISKDTFYSDIREVFDEMMVIAFGVDGILFPQ